MLQRIEVIGNLVQDAELKSGREDKEFISFRVAASETVAGEKRTTYYDVTLSKSGVIDYLKKGQQVYVSGKLSLSAVCREDKAFLNANILAKDLVLVGGNREN